MEDRRDPAIGFIGVGLLGRALALSLAARQYRVVAAHSRSLSSAQWLADRVPGCRALATAQELADAADLVFITTPDAAIGAVASTVTWRAGQGAVHCSGASSTEVLLPAARQGAVTGAFHPFQTFAGVADPAEAVARLSGVTFAVAGHGWVAEFLTGLARNLGGRAVAVADADRPLYHAAGALGCGYLVALLSAAARVLQAAGLSPEEAIDALGPISRVTLENVSRHGMEASVTGPAFRGDTATIRSHLEALAERMPELIPLYCSLAEAALPLAAARGVEKVQLAAMREILDSHTGAAHHT